VATDGSRGPSCHGADPAVSASDGLCDSRRRNTVLFGYRHNSSPVAPPEGGGGKLLPYGCTER